jgi:hypothetical protein
MAPADPPPAAPYTPGLAAQTAVQTAAPASQMDYPLRLIAEARQSYQSIRDYTCLFVKREEINGQLQPDNLMEMKVRTQPYSVYFRWLGPQSMLGQEVCYVTGRNNGMMRVHSTGIRALGGWVSIAPDDPRATASSRHMITESGIGNLIDRYAVRWEKERSINKTQVRVAQYSYNQRPCIRVEAIHPDNTGREFYAYRTVVYFDKENHLPIRIENYNWPRPGGPAEGTLLESYSYAHLRLNVGVPEVDFNH